MTVRTIVIATPHARHDALESRVRDRLAGVRVLRIREKSEMMGEFLAPIAPDFIFAVHWSWLVPRAVHENYPCIIFHMSDVPYGRGGSPLQNLIARGHSETMLTALKCVAELDAGPVYRKRPLSLDGSAEEILARAGALMEEMIVGIAENEPSPVPQEGDVVHFKRREPAEGDLGSVEDIRRSYDYIRMLDADGYPPAFIETDSLRLEFTNATLHADHVEATVRITKR